MVWPVGGAQGAGDENPLFPLFGCFLLTILTPGAPWEFDVLESRDVRVTGFSRCVSPFDVSAAASGVCTSLMEATQNVSGIGTLDVVYVATLPSGQSRLRDERLII